MKAKHGRRLGMLVNRNSGAEKKLRKRKVQREKGTNHGMLKQHDVEDREQGRRLGNEKWKD